MFDENEEHRIREIKYQQEIYDYINKQLGIKLNELNRLADKVLLIQKKKVLVVEDSKSINTFLSNFFRRHYNLKVDSALNGKEGLKLLDYNDNDYGLITVDLNMPEVNGFQFLERLLQLNNYIPRIVITSMRLNESDSDRLFELGVLKLFLKPNFITKLIEFMDNYFNIEAEYKNDYPKVEFKEAILE